MNEIKLVRELKKLNQIKPEKQFVLSTKKQILGEEPRFGLFVNLKPVYAGVFGLFLLLAMFQVQNALPGESLFYLKKIAERGQIMFSSEDQKPGLSLLLANKRLADLSFLAEEDKAQRLAPAIDEFKANVKEVVKNLAKITEVDEKIVAQIKELEDNKQEVERILATKIETQELDNALADLVQREIEYLGQRTLNEEDLEILEQVKELFEKQEYSESLVKILELNHN